MKKEQDLTSWKIAQKLSGIPPPARKKRWKEYESRLRTIIENYATYEKLDFLKVIGNLTMN